MNIKQVICDVVIKVFGSSAEYLSKEKEIEQAIMEAFRVEEIEEMTEDDY